MVLMKKLIACSHTAKPLPLFYWKWVDAVGNRGRTWTLDASSSQQALFHSPSRPRRAASAFLLHRDLPSLQAPRRSHSTGKMLKDAGLRGPPPRRSRTRAEPNPNIVTPPPETVQR